MENENNKEADFLRNSAPADIKPGLERIKKLCERLNNPQDKLNIIHITGTNGKGSTGAFIVHSLISCGYKVGWFCTPAVTKEWECIRVFEPDKGNEKNNIGYNYSSNIYNKLHKKDLDSKAREDADFSLKNITDFFKPDIYRQCQNEVEETDDINASVFEKQTALAFLYFHKMQVDFAVIEVGMGGLEDATNIINKSLISVITNIAFDHEAFLGKSIEEIAYHKAGIIKSGRPVILGAGEKDSARRIVYEEASKKGSRIYMPDFSEIEIKSLSLEGAVFYLDGENYSISLLGRHQVYNACLAIKTLHILKQTYPDICERIEDKYIRKGLSKAKISGRLEIISKDPYVIYDGAHNPHAAKALKATIEDIFEGRNIYAVCGVYKDKDAAGILEILSPVITELIAISPEGNRGMEADELLELWEKVTFHQKHGRCMRDVVESVELTRYKLKSTDPTGVIIVFGSLSLRRSL